MNIAVIFAGGVGSRMKSKKAKPKQFLEMYGKPIIIYTLEKFEENNLIDAIVISCLKEWIGYLEELIAKYGLKKVKKIVEGGKNGQESIYNGLNAANELAGREKSIVLIHDGVRPFIDSETITANIESVRKYGSAITTVPVVETIMIVSDNNKIEYIPNRNKSRLARAPQSFWLDEILEVHKKSLRLGLSNFIDSCTMMQYFGKEMYLVDGPEENIKITTPSDFYTMRALLDAKENAQIYGYEE